MGTLNKEEFVMNLNNIKSIVSKCHIVNLSFQNKNKSFIIPLNYGYEIYDNNLILYCYCNNKVKNLDFLIDCSSINIEIVNDNSIYKQNLEVQKIQSNAKVEFIYDIYDKVRGLNKIIDHSTTYEKNEFKNKVINSIILLKITCNDLIVNL